MVMTHIYIVLKNDEMKQILTARSDKRNEFSTTYNRGVSIIGVIDNCLGIIAIGLGITGVGLLSTIVAAPAVIGIEAVSIVMGLLRVVGNQAIKQISLKIEKHEKIAMLTVYSLSIIRWFHFYSLILLEFETFTRMKEDLREKSKMILEKNW